MRIIKPLLLITFLSACAHKCPVCEQCDPKIEILEYPDPRVPKKVQSLFAPKRVIRRVKKTNKEKTKNGAN